MTTTKTNEPTVWLRDKMRVSVREKGSHSIDWEKELGKHAITRLIMFEYETIFKYQIMSQQRDLTVFFSFSFCVYSDFKWLDQQFITSSKLQCLRFFLPLLMMMNTSTSHLYLIFRLKHSLSLCDFTGCCIMRDWMMQFEFVYAIVVDDGMTACSCCAADCRPAYLAIPRIFCKFIRHPPFGRVNAFFYNNYIKREIYKNYEKLQSL